MNNLQRNILEDKLNIVLSDEVFKKFQKYCELFLEFNSHTNLMSKNDEKVLFEKHIFDSLSLNLFFKDCKINSMLDIGTGGGFPSVPIAICFNQINVVALDSIQKKLNFIENVKQELKLDNLKIICKRAENIDMTMKNNFDLVTCRAVSELKNLFYYTVPYMKSNGYFVAFKSKIYQEEINNSKNVMKKFNIRLLKTIDYNLPLNENFERKLLVFKKIK